MNKKRCHQFFHHVHHLPNKLIRYLPIFFWIKTFSAVLDEDENGDISHHAKLAVAAAMILGTIIACLNENFQTSKKIKNKDRERRLYSVERSLSTESGSTTVTGPIATKALQKLLQEEENKQSQLLQEIIAFLDFSSDKLGVLLSVFLIFHVIFVRMDKTWENISLSISSVLGVMGGLYDTVQASKPEREISQRLQSLVAKTQQPTFFGNFAGDIELAETKHECKQPIP